MKIKQGVWKRGSLKVFLSFCLLWLLSISGCVPPEGAKKTEEKEPYKWNEIQLASTPAQKDYPEAAAVFLLKEAHLIIKKEATVIKSHYIIKIFGERGKRYADVKLPFKSGFSEIFGIHARTIKPDGSILELQPSQIHEVSLFPNMCFIQTARLKSLLCRGWKIMP